MQRNNPNQPGSAGGSRMPPPMQWQGAPLRPPGQPAPQQGPAFGPQLGQTWTDPNNPGVLYYEGFEAGARFSDVAPPRIPPPPPGCPPNPAQQAQMAGQNVVVTQRKEGFLQGGGSGGVDTSCSLQ
ncbi:DAZ-associated protein, putative [Ixodes scapularis]|uniref:DAZ-associated protein 2 n=1 Tax=Ixodes scapularis TaxID=6945 RepID=B7Q6A2_IXOSC|nr:DAZ-associated protein, putative [Ixodes scapularis]|eukprot:XP_002411918.1 DAZ-associated protein, putative [Ixodes scapularis]